MDFIRDRKTAAQSARAIVAARPLYLDTETTGLGSEAEICDIAVVDSDGSVILSTLIRPMRPIPPEAEAIHGITNDMVNHAPLFGDVWPLLCRLFVGRPVVTYNAAYDSRLVEQSWTSLYATAVTKGAGHGKHFDYRCAMLLFAQFYGDFNSIRRSYKWQRLDVAARCAGYPAWAAHRALGDTLATRAVVEWLAQQEG